MSSQDDFVLTTDELRVVTRYCAECAQESLPIFERDCPSDPRARTAIDAAWLFADGAPRTNLQRVAATAAHRAARDASTLAASAAAHAAGDAAASAYLHPLAHATQVGHLLRAAAFAARAQELAAGDESVGEQVIERARLRATPPLLDVLRRYPPAPVGKNRVDRLWQALDTALRAQ